MCLWKTAGIVAFVVTNCYWWLKTTNLRESLTVSKEWDADVDGTGVTSEESLALRRAIEAASAPPTELPARIETYRERIENLETDRDRLQTLLAESWWDGLERTQPTDAPTVLTVELSSGTVEEARAIASGATETEQIIAIVITGDGKFAVGAGQTVAQTLSAESVAGMITAETTGGSGGSEQFATGGGIEYSRLRTVVETIVTDVQTQIQ